MKKGEGEKLLSQYSTTDASGLYSRDCLEICSKVQVRSKYLNCVFQKVRPKPFIFRASSFLTRQSKRTASFTEGVSFQVHKTSYSQTTKKHTRQSPYSSGKTSQTTPFPAKSRNRHSFSGKSDGYLCFSSIERIETISEHHIQLTQYIRNYGDISFSSSEIIAGPNPKNRIRKQAATVNRVVRRQFEPILRYQFSKLTRNDILPSLSHDLKQSILSKMQQRMSGNLKESLFSISPSEDHSVGAN